MNKNVRHLVVTVALLLNLFGFFFYQKSKQIEYQNAQQKQIDHLQMIAKKLDEFALVSDLLSAFIQGNIRDENLSQKQIEKRLHDFLQSSPNELIYGIGIWYEPYLWNKNQKLFGPYVHRQGQNQIQLTYEWNTDDYYYPKQNWYIAGKTAGGQSAFVDPYFDAGLIYVTNSRAFFDRSGKILGVISVDLVLPMLQDLIEKYQQSQYEQIMITDSSGHLLAHPLKGDFLKHISGLPEYKDKTLIDFTFEDLSEKLNLKNKEFEIQKIRQSQLGWYVISQAEAHFFRQNIEQLRNVLIVLLLFMWAIVAVYFRNSKKREMQYQIFESEIEKGKMQLIQSSKMAALGEMASGIAHEINNPVAIIVGLSERSLRKIEKEPIPKEKLIETFQRIQETALRITQIIRGLRSFSRSAENDPFVLESLNKIIHDTVSLFREKISAHQIEMQILDFQDIYVSCRPAQLQQVLLNLIGNSIDAISDLEEKWIKITVDTQIDPHFYLINIIDSGKGIEASIVDKLMQPFFTTKEVGKGTGLGLSISKGVIEDHRGRLDYVPGKPNTTFTIFIPKGSH
jgi:signal transduction histidine kinase